MNREHPLSNLTETVMSNPSDRVLGTPPTNTPAINQPLPASLYRPTDITPEQLFQAIGKLRKEARDEIDRLVRFLDETENHMELEPEDEGDDGELEPSLGSFDRMTDQSKAWQQRGEFCSGSDTEQDDSDHEDSDPEELSEASGIGDHDGMQEQLSGQVYTSGLKIDGVL
jgi:hypothetical protein